MVSFAQRMGLRPVPSLVQKDSLDAETRVELWNLTYNLWGALQSAVSQWDSFNPISENVTAALWAWQFKKPRDEQPRDNAVWAIVKDQIITGNWADALDLIEAIVGFVERYKTHNSAELAALAESGYNNTFESFLVGYRFVGFKLIPIDSEMDLQAAKAGLDDAMPFKGARHHLEQANKLLADRKNPDYPNVIKESISAVESLCAVITGEHSLGDALKKLEGSGAKIHPALKSAWLKMYGWASDDDGIRHGGIEAPEADQSLAKYMLVTCSAFVSHVIEIARKAGLL